MAEANGALIGGRYQLLDLIGQGGMGRVWRGRDETLGREVAVKQVLLPQGIGDEQRAVLLQRVMREARAAARLNHPGIITVHDVVEHEGAPAIVMEYVTGTSLGAAVAGEGGLPVRRVAEIGALMLKALVRAHASGTIHRDLKPDNVLLSDDRVVITDFGIAHVSDATMTLTHTGTVIGTPAYMAPEQLEGEPPTPATDLWSLGATLYSAVEGRPPFSADTFSALCVAIVMQDPPVPERAGALAPVLAGLLTKDPARRSTAEEALAALEAVARGEGAAAARPAPTGREDAPPVRGGGGTGDQEGPPGAAVETPAPAEAATATGPRPNRAWPRLLRGGACFAVVWVNAYLWYAALGWHARWAVGPLLTAASVLAAVNGALEPRRRPLVAWLVFAGADLAVSCVAAAATWPALHWGWAPVLLNALLVATASWSLWRRFPAASRGPHHPPAPAPPRG
ncbi:serine/threonine-protein kinase [Streptomyces sp. HUAS TT3]|uniref:serine/threonine-protein kinase n=1 Tax=Streptomyces sp. HUAS TT3 TaxID=3447510 RepID=UPI003F65C5F5